MSRSSPHLPEIYQISIESGLSSPMTVQWSGAGNIVSRQRPNTHSHQLVNQPQSAILITLCLTRYVLVLLTHPDGQQPLCQSHPINRCNIPCHPLPGTCRRKKPRLPIQDLRFRVNSLVLRREGWLVLWINHFSSLVGLTGHHQLSRPVKRSTKEQWHRPLPILRAAPVFGVPSAYERSWINVSWCLLVGVSPTLTGGQMYFGVQSVSAFKKAPKCMRRRSLVNLTARVRRRKDVR